MKHSFYLREPQNRIGKKSTLILFTCHFNKEKKKFVYSTGERIAPMNWSFENKGPKLKGDNRATNANSIRQQLQRYSIKFEELVALQSKINEDLTSKVLKECFDEEFKKGTKTKDIFYLAYDSFTEEKIKRREWKPSTIKRYKNIKNHLLEFEKQVSYKLTFSNINERFYTDFTDYCYSTLDHGTNTFARNVGLFKTFMFWALKEKYTYNEAFKNFKKPERVVTQEVALTLDQVKTIFEFEAKSKSLDKVKDIFVFQCLTGLRYGELKLISERTVRNGMIILKEDKDVIKEIREIPLFEITKYILKKYNNQLPLISNQKQNELIKIVFKNAEFDFDVEYTRNKNKHKETLVKPFYDRISSHTGRRSFITILKKKGVADKTIMKMTGHRDLKTFNTYYKVDLEAKRDAIELAFGSMELPKLKRA
ncbi:tyrosine-type recombinase/integrase [Winogradskyella sp. SYSU M77433]|uniref:tyrosine-type recombinase/integrase n=1 Tax=Winogradskyella sp. SYSU M77433 TaxID=3042722 RepID=UPI00247FF16C|nr:tyrosine-type recombinase/integrase [Winogradskyella sp. SYSU M77433]MDH7913213.1 tyrosine-type recombinase/integrase [Winogradskyella sp. SYSU M77433]